MKLQNKIIITVVVIVSVFYVGRYTAPTKVETKTITVEVEKEKETRK
jgi:hypothetical protein